MNTEQKIKDNYQMYLGEILKEHEKRIQELEEAIINVQRR